jgi:hypothetical protein
LLSTATLIPEPCAVPSIAHVASADCGDVGLSPELVDAIFHAEGLPAAPTVELAQDTPPATAAWVRREHQAAEFSYRALEERAVQTPDPWHGAWASCRQGHLVPRSMVPEAYHVPLAYRFRSQGGRPFWLLTFHPYGRVTHIYIPDRDCVVHDLYGPPSEGLRATFRRLETHARRTFLASRAARRTVAVLDMVDNLGHQCLNSLSGLLRMVDAGLLPDRIWVSGTEFFPPVETLFPSLASRVKRFADDAVMVQFNRRRRVLPVRPTTNVCLRRLVQRIYAEAGSPSRPTFGSSGRRPILAVSIRTGDRQCRNTVELAAHLYGNLAADYPRLGILIDGFVIPEGADASLAASARYRRPVQRDQALETAIRNALPTGAVVASTVGRRMLASLKMILAADAYLAGVGTLQHKLAFFADLRGVAHGPSRSLREPDTGHYSIEAGHAPLFLPPDWVEDDPHSSPHEERRDYRVVNLGGVAQLIRRCLDLAASDPARG